jgi:hypothetical protein
MNVIWPYCVSRFSHAITVAEGSDPDWNNPGDMTISLGFRTVGVANAAGVLKFAQWIDGEYVLCHQCYLMLSGKSEIYSLSMTLAQAGLKYSGGDPNWAKNAAAVLDLPVTATLYAVSQLKAV